MPFNNEHIPVKSTQKIILSNHFDEQISLEKIPNNQLEQNKKFKEVFVPDLSLVGGAISQSFLQVSNQAMTLAEIAKKAPNGLFTSTHSPEFLAKFKNGTFSTIVRDVNGKIKEQAGFSQIDLTLSVNPAMVLSAGMQAMAAISGTYYLKKIDSQIEMINNRLEELISLHHDKNIGILMATKKGLSEISSREYIDVVDLNAIRNYKKSVDEVHEEYIYRLQRMKKDFNLTKKVKIEEEKIDDIDFTITIAFEANKLSLLAELIEISIRLKMTDQMNIISSLTKQLKMNYENSFYYNIENRIQDVFLDKINENAESLLTKNEKHKKAVKNLKETNFFNNPKYLIAEVGVKTAVVLKQKSDVVKIQKEIDSKDKKIKAILENVMENQKNLEIETMIKELTELPHKEHELLLVPSDSNQQRLFIPFAEEE
ncbi:hypothetical protein [Kurthia senegalensis]|uniref:hypothetical protein n=1 Tax=Kurthia senegalensis TaxID=1033740 RepID=UPI0002892885|nr:hypothetical protein [Kurthia senegalensis]